MPGIGAPKNFDCMARAPLLLLPKTRSYKCIEDGHYRFCVSISLLLLGTVLSYGRLLQA